MTLYATMPFFTLPALPLDFLVIEIHHRLNTRS